MPDITKLLKRTIRQVVEFRDYFHDELPPDAADYIKDFFADLESGLNNDLTNAETRRILKLSGEVLATFGEDPPFNDGLKAKILDKLIADIKRARRELDKAPSRNPRATVSLR